MNNHESKKQVRKTKPRRYLRPISVLLTVLVLVIILSFATRLHQVRIEFDIISSSVEFKTIDKQHKIDIGSQPIIRDLDFREIGFSEFESVEISNQRPIGPTPFWLKVIRSKESYITLEQLIVPENTTISLLVTEDDIYNATIICNDEDQKCKDEISLELELNNIGQNQENIEISSPSKGQFKDGSLIVYPASHQKIFRLLRFSFSPLINGIKIAQQAKISSLNFMYIDDISDITRVEPEPISGIESGTIYYDFTDRDIILRSGEKLSFGSLSGTLRMVKLKNDLLQVQFSGDVTSMKSGQRSLMPTYFERWREVDLIKVVAALVLAVIGGGLLNEWLTNKTNSKS